MSKEKKGKETENQIEEKIKSLKKGSILFIADFIEFGTAENVKKVLLRLEKKEVLIRLAHGIYLYPKKDKILGTQIGRAHV